eukprot:15009323-Heterocapsa_arctica.AAC.1
MPQAVSDHPSSLFFGSLWSLAASLRSIAYGDKNNKHQIRWNKNKKGLAPKRCSRLGPGGTTWASAKHKPSTS